MHQSDKFSNVLFWDESVLQLFENRVLVWWWPGVDERPIANQAFCKDKVMIGGGISRKRKTKLRYWRLDQKETVDAIAYSSALDDVVLDVMDNAYGYGNWRFLHDGAPSHTANITKNHLAVNDVKVFDASPLQPRLKSD